MNNSDFLKFNPLCIVVPVDNAYRADKVLTGILSRYPISWEKVPANDKLVEYTITCNRTTFAQAYFTIGVEFQRARIFKP